MTKMRIAVLGPEYSYSHLVGKNIPKQELIFCSKIEEVFQKITEKS